MATKRKTKDLHISPRLVHVLEKISNKSEIARLLLRTKFNKEELVEDPIDFISISKEDPTKLTYLTSDKIYKSGYDEYNSDDIEDIWKLNKIPAKPGVALKKLFKEVHEKDVELFTTLFKAAVSQKDFELKIITGDEMIKYYGHRSYYGELSGSLHNSCMKHDHCRDYFDIYTKNPQVCKMLVMLDGRGNLLGRTLLWNAINSEDNTEVLVMDRIYCVDDSKNAHYFKEWADQNGYIYKKEQRWQNCMFFESHGSTRFLKLHVAIKKTPFTRYPYVDTFKFWDEKKSIICNYLPSDNGYVRTLMGNNGNTLGGDVLGLDSLQKLYVHREHLIYLPYIDGRIHADYSVWSETMQISLAREHAIYDEDIKDWIFNTEFNKFNDSTKLNARREQVRRLNEQRAKKMVSSRKSRASNSELYNGAFLVEEREPQPDRNQYDEAVHLYERLRERANRPGGGAGRGEVRAPGRGAARREERRDGDVAEDRAFWPQPEPAPAPPAPAVEQPVVNNDRLRINNNTVLDQLIHDLEDVLNDMNNDRQGNI